MRAKDYYFKQAVARTGTIDYRTAIVMVGACPRPKSGAYVQAWVWVPAPLCAKCRDRITSFRGVRQTKDGALFHGRCWDNTRERKARYQAARERKAQ